MKTKTQVSHTSTPYPVSKIDTDALTTILLGNQYRREAVDVIVRAVNAYQRHLKFVRDYLSGDVNERQLIDEAREIEVIAKAEGK